MKKVYLILVSAILLFGGMSAGAQEAAAPEKAIMLFGASFAVPENSWFEMGCGELNFEPINKSVSGEAIYHDAYRMAAGSDYTVEELDRTEWLVLMHVHNQNVANETNLKENWEDYTEISSTRDYAVAYDYVIKRYIYDCAQLEYNENSIYYGVEGGKPARIMLCTHWHDGRAEYNAAIRKLAQRWNFPLVEFDTKIGFSKEDNQEDKGAPSREFCSDTEKLYDVTFGWHPQRGTNREIQQRMAAIFAAAVAEESEIALPFDVNASPLCSVIKAGEDAKVLVSFSGGMFPYQLSFDNEEYVGSAKNMIVTRENILENSSLSFSAESESASSLVQAMVATADYVALPDYDSYISYAQSGNSFDSAGVLQLKNKANSGRKIYVSFPVSEDMPSDADKIILRLYLTKCTLDPDFATYPRDGFETLRVEGNTAVYGGLTWGNTNNSNHEQSWDNGKISSSVQISTDMVNSWIGIDVTDWVNETRKALYATHNDYNKGHLTFRLTLEPSLWFTLFEFYSSEGAPVETYASVPQPGGPQLLFTRDFTTGVNEVESPSGIKINGDIIINPAGEPISIYRVDGLCVYNGDNSEVSMEGMPGGLYIIHSENGNFKILK